VSRSSNSALAIGLGACGVAVGVRPSGLQRLRGLTRRPRVEAPPVDAPVPPPPAIAHASIAMVEEECFSERGALEVLRQALGSDADDASDASDSGAPNDRVGPKRRAFIVLDDFWANHAILRGDFRSMRAREVDEIALAYFTDTFGLEAGSLLVRSVVQRGGRTLFASAMSRSLHDGIHEVSASARVEVRSLTLGLPQILNRVRHAVGGSQAMLVVVAETLLHTVLMDHDRWVAYDTQRLFPEDAGDASRLAAVAEHVFERSAAMRREDCMVYLCGLEVDASAFEQRFAGARRLPGPTPSGSPALRLMGFAQ
jgi:hypothetical protein